LALGDEEHEAAALGGGDAGGAALSLDGESMWRGHAPLRRGNGRPVGP